METIIRKHTCDRCGEEIKNPVSDYKGFGRIFGFPKSMLMEKVGVGGYITSVPEDLLSDSVDLEIAYKSKRKIIELCPKCKKEFEQFMIRR